MSRRSLKAAAFSGCLVVLLSGCGQVPRARIDVPVAGPLHLDGVTIVDTENGALAPGMSILMDGGKIVRIAPASSSIGNEDACLMSAPDDTGPQGCRRDAYGSRAVLTKSGDPADPDAYRSAASRTPERL